MRTPEQKARNRAYYLKTREKQLVDAKKRRNSPEGKERLSLYEKQYYLKNKEKKKEYYMENKDEILSVHKKHREVNKDKERKRSKAYHASHPEVELRRCCKKRGISVLLYYLQPKECAACHTQNPGSRSGKLLKSWPIDHCHKTNRFRGLLCSPCNLALGILKDDPVRCQQLLDYLKKTSS